MIQSDSLAPIISTLPESLPKSMSIPFLNLCPKPCPNGNFNQSLPLPEPLPKTKTQTLARTLPQMEISMLEYGWLALHHPIPNSKFPLITALAQTHAQTLQ